MTEEIWIECNCDYKGFADMVKFEEEIKEYLTKESSSKILFPMDFDELKEILL